MTFAYADPPYLGCCAKYEHYHPDGKCWDDLDTHVELIARLVAEFPDGWALSLSSTSLRTILPLCPEGARIGAWVKPFAAFKPNVNPAYTWEPVIFCGGRKRDRDVSTVRDFVSANIALEKGLTGAKPPKFCGWVLQLLGYQVGDVLVDLYPGTGSMTDALHTATMARLFA